MDNYGIRFPGAGGGGNRRPRYVTINHSGGTSRALAEEFIRQLQAAIPGVRVVEIIHQFPILSDTHKFKVHEADRTYFRVTGLQFNEEYDMNAAQVNLIFTRIANAPPA